MLKNPTKRPRDLNKLAATIVQDATDPTVKITKTDPGKNPHAVALGRLGGKKGGKARSEKLSPERRSEIARKAALARYSKDR